MLQCIVPLQIIIIIIIIKCLSDIDAAQLTVQFERRGEDEERDVVLDGEVDVVVVGAVRVDHDGLVVVVRQPEALHLDDPGVHDQDLALANAVRRSDDDVLGCK